MLGHRGDPRLWRLLRGPREKVSDQEVSGSDRVRPAAGCVHEVSSLDIGLEASLSSKDGCRYWLHFAPEGSSELRDKRQEQDKIIEWEGEGLAIN